MERPGKHDSVLTWKYAFHLLLVLVLSGWSSELSASRCSSRAAAAAAAAVGDAPAAAAAAAPSLLACASPLPPARGVSLSGARLAPLLELAWETSGLGCEPGAASSPAGMEPSCFGSTMSSCGLKVAGRDRAGQQMEGRVALPMRPLVWEHGVRACRWDVLGIQQERRSGRLGRRGKHSPACAFPVTTDGRDAAACPERPIWMTAVGPAHSRQQCRGLRFTAWINTAGVAPHLAKLGILGPFAAESALPMAALWRQQAQQQAPDGGTQPPFPRLIGHPLKRQRPQRLHVYGWLLGEQSAESCRARCG